MAEFQSSKIENLSFEDIILWVERNKSEVEYMDVLNQMTFPYTSKYVVWKREHGVFNKEENREWLKEFAEKFHCAD